MYKSINQMFQLRRFFFFSDLKDSAFYIMLCFGIIHLNAQNNTVERTGNVLLFILPASAVAATLISNDKEGSWQFAKGFLVNEAITIGLKAVISKERPDLTNHNAFPSGHTSTTFQSASFLQRRYGWKYGIPAYALAGFTAFSRIEAEKHDGWDILGGVIIGIGSTYLFTKPYQQKHMQLTFERKEHGAMLGFLYNF